MMKTDNIMTALSEFSSEADIPVSLIRHSARRATTRNQNAARAGAKIIPMTVARPLACVA